MNNRLLRTFNQPGKEGIQDNPSILVRHQNLRKSAGGVVAVHYVSILFAGQLFAGGVESFSTPQGNRATDLSAFLFDRNLDVGHATGKIIINGFFQKDFKPRQLTNEFGPASWCKSVSVNCLSSLRLAPSGVRRSEGERSEPSAAEPRRGQGAPRAKSWSRAGHIGFLLGCRQTLPTTITT